MKNNINYLFDKISETYGVSRREIMSQSRKRHISDVRTALSCVLVNYFNMTTLRAGKIIDRDHSTIVHHTKSIDIIEINAIYRHLIEILNNYDNYCVDQFETSNIEYGDNVFCVA